MAGTIADAIDWIVTQAAAVTGIAAAGTPDDFMGVNDIKVTVFESEADYATDADHIARDLSTITVLMTLPRGDLASAITVLKGKPLALANKIRTDPSMGGNVQTYGGLTSRFFGMPWQGLDEIGYQITISGVKIRSTIS